MPDLVPAWSLALGLFESPADGDVTQIVADALAWLDDECRHRSDLRPQY